jgi:hypothetical protein
MTHASRRLARLIQQLEQRVTDVEQGRPPDAPERRVANVTEDGLDIGPETVSSTKITDPVAQFDSGDDFNRSEFP